MNNQTIKNILLTFGSVILVAVVGTIFTNLGMEWFEGLIKPSEWLPSWIIPIVWTVIYLVASITLYLWSNSRDIPGAVIVLYIINGILNVLWCLVFFTLNSLFLGVVLILLNLVFAIYLVMQVEKYRPIYARALLVYPVWLFLATALNLAVWILN